MDRAALVLVFDHILEGYDIPTPAGMLRVRQDMVAAKADNLPYSLLTNLAHTVLWQDFWLNKLAGGPKKSTMNEWQNDFRVPGDEEWPELRKRFLEGLRQARETAASEPFAHKCDSDSEAVDALVRIAVHGAYHLGQMNLLKRAKDPARLDA